MTNICNCILDIGNEEFLESTRIVGDRIKEVLDNGIFGDDLSFWVDDKYECQDECNSRYFFRNIVNYINFSKKIAQII